MITKNYEQDSYEDLVALRYLLYNSLFLTLPFSTLSKYGAELPLFGRICKQRLEQGDEPSVIVEEFLTQTLGIKDLGSQQEILFIFLQLVERQILLFDAVERAAADELVGKRSELLLSTLKNELSEKKAIRVVLTAHPTQYYPEFLLGLINDISNAVQKNDAGMLRKLLLQLGRTSFKNPNPPTPFEEAEMLIDQFGKIFHDVFIDLAMEWPQNPPRLELGFWPGGDRDGNPYVTVETTRKVCERLRAFAIRCIVDHVEQLRRRITFKGVTQNLLKMHQRLRNDEYENPEEIKQDLQQVLEQVDRDHGGLFREEVLRALSGISLFGFHFASLDLRQNSDAIGATIEKLEPKYSQWDESQKIKWLENTPPLSPAEIDLIQVLQLVPEVQKRNGPYGLHRFIVSHTSTILHLLEIFYLSSWFAQGKLDIVPLFESIDDMLRAPAIMEELFSHAPYLDHLRKREMKQTVMLGFSDGTKDGGYVTCNWEILKCKEQLSKVCSNAGVDLVFFDGRGGPPGARRGFNA